MGPCGRDLRQHGGEVRTACLGTTRYVLLSVSAEANVVGPVAESDVRLDSDGAELRLGTGCNSIPSSGSNP